MAKIRPYVPDPATGYTVFFYHIGGPAAGPGHPWHLIWWYHPCDQPGPGWWPFANVDSIDKAKTFAALGARLPQLLRDLCWQCWGYDWWHLETPWLPRWNIYRSPNRLRTVPGFVWPFPPGDPPPGYNWLGT